MNDEADRSGPEQGPFDGLATDDGTIADVVGRLRAAGFAADLVFEPDDIPSGVFCRQCGRRHLPAKTTLHQLHRVGSEADGEAVVAALECPCCGARGVIVTGYGASATPQESELHRALASTLREDRA